MTSTELREARINLGLTQKAMASLLQTPRRTYQDWERGVYPVPGACAVAMLLLSRPGAVEWVKSQAE